MQDRKSIPLPERASTIPDFCKRWGFSVPTFNRRRHEMPLVTKVNHRSWILEDDEAKWAAEIRRKSEQAQKALIPTRRLNGTYAGHVPLQ